MADETRQRGRPRSETSRRAILAAADDLLLRQGLDAVSMDAVAERAGVSKATIYRWWGSKELLALEALLLSWEHLLARVRADTGTLEGDVRALLRPWVKRISTEPYARVVAALIAEAHRDPEFAGVWRELFVATRRHRMRAAFARAADRGEIPRGTDVELAIDMLYGPLYHRLLHGHAPLNEAVAFRLIDAVLAGIPGLVVSA